MKITYKRALYLALFLLPLLFLAACKKNDAEQFNKATPTLFQYISSNKQLSLYRAALNRAGMFNATTFSNGGPFTVFAPVDSAFINVGLTLDSINRFDPQALALALKYNIVYGKISNSTLVGFYTQNAQSLNPVYKPNITKNYYGIFIDGIPLAAGGSIDLNDGVLHQLKRVALPPAGNLFEVISKAPDLTFYTAVIKLIGYQTLYSTPTAPSYFSVFAPTNDAFKKFGYPDIESINNAGASRFKNLIDSYRMNGQQFTSGFIGGYDVTGGNLFVDIDGFTIEAISNITPTHIVRPDILSTNAVIQVVDQVIVPFTF